MDFIQVLAMHHGERCFHPQLREVLGPAVVALADMSKEVQFIQLAGLYTGLFAFWPDSSDLLRHVEPVWDIIETAAKFAAAFANLRLEIDRLFKPDGVLVPLQGGVPEWHHENG